MTRDPGLPLWFRVVCGALALIALARAVALLAHDPLLAIANNFDQIRYSACLHLAPARSGVPAQQSNPTAPLREYAFQPVPPIACTMTSDLVVTAPLAAAWWLGDRVGTDRTHSIRALGALRFAVFALVITWTILGLLRAGAAHVVLALLAWFAIVAMDPVNTLYFSTFYAESAALFGWIACACAVLVALFRPARGALAAAAFGALLLGTSKYQHLALPLLLGLALLIGGNRAMRRLAGVVLFGGAVAFVLQIADVARQGAPARAIANANHANFALSLLLPVSSDPTRVKNALSIEPPCAAFAGKSIFFMPGPVETVCTHVGEWRQSELWWLLISDPPGLARAIGRTVPSLLPWLPLLGVVEGERWQTLPNSQPSLVKVFSSLAWCAWLLLLLPWLVFASCVAHRAPRQARGFALMCASGSSGIAAASMFGEGIVDFGKHAQLAIDISLASLGAPLAAWAQRALRLRAET